MHQLFVVFPLLVLHEVVSQTSEGEILHDETEIPSTWERPQMSGGVPGENVR